MANAVQGSLRSDILGGFDKKAISTIGDIQTHLIEKGYNTSYQTTRRHIKKMVSEGLLIELKQRTSLGQYQYAKAIFTNVSTFISPSGKLLPLHEYLQAIIEYEPNLNLIDSSALEAIKVWMLDILASCSPDAYIGKRDTPNPEELKHKLNRVLATLRETHAFIKAFVDSDVWTPVAKEKLSSEFNPAQLAAIVDRTWIDE